MSTSQAFPDPYLIIRASAGTGKTYELSSRYVSLLQRDVPPEEILATTFTRKAAGEILERILLRLAKGSTDATELQRLAEAIGDSSLSSHRCQQLLMRVARNLHRQRVGTLDSFFAQLATTHSLELGLPPGWQIADEQATARLQAAAIAALLAGHRESDVTRLVHLVGKGDAGRQVAELLANTVRELHEQCQGTSEPAWQQIPRCKCLEPAELAELLDELEVTPLPSDRRATTARQKDLENARRENWEELLRVGLAAKICQGETTYCKKDIPAETIERYKRLLSHVCGVLLTQLANQNQGTYDLLQRFNTEFERLKNEHRVLTFSDLKHQLARQPELEDGDRWAFRMDGRISHLLLDEFQDTSPDQWQVIEPIARRLVGAPVASFFCVGDAKQAIYGWRGGEARLFDALRTRLGNLNVQPRAKSYRSAQVIVDVTNEVFENLLNHNSLEHYEPSVRAWAQGFDRHETEWIQRRGYVTLETAPRCADNQKQPDATLVHAAERIKELATTIRRRSIGVLVRKNDSVSRLIYELGRRGVPASEEGQSAITDSAAVELILSLVHWLDNPGDRVALYHVASSRLAAAIELPDPQQTTPLWQFASEQRRKLSTAGYGPVISEWASRLVPHASRREAERLRQLSQLAYDYQPQATLRPSDFVAYVRQRRIEVPQSVPVRVMTIHQAKGLEFDIVVLPELDEKLIGLRGTLALGRGDVAGPIDAVCLRRGEHIRHLLPDRLQQLFRDDDEREINESLCRLYVGITRAVYALHMIIAPSRKDERSLPKTSAALVRAALVGTSPVGPCETLYERGDRSWYEVETKGLLPETDDESSSSTLVTVQLAAPRESRRRTHTSPSQLEKVTPYLNVFSANRAEAKFSGRLFHALLERIEWLDDGLPEEAQFRRVALHYGLLPQKWDDVWQRFRALLDADPIANVLSRAAYDSPKQLGFPPPIAAMLEAGPLERTVRREQPIAAATDGHFVEGVVDRLVLLTRGAEVLAADIVDFKSDAFAAENAVKLAERVDAHRPQIESYRRAVAQMWRLDLSRVTARLAFTAIGKVASL